MRGEKGKEYDESLAAGHALAWRGEWQSAAEVYKRAAAHRPQDPSARAFLALALARLSQFPQALGELEAALELDPHNTLLLSKTVELQLQLGDPRAASATLVSLSDILAKNGFPEPSTVARRQSDSLLVQSTLAPPLPSQSPTPSATSQASAQVAEQESVPPRSAEPEPLVEAPQPEVGSPAALVRPADSSAAGTAVSAATTTPTAEGTESRATLSDVSEVASSQPVAAKVASPPTTPSAPSETTAPPTPTQVTPSGEAPRIESGTETTARPVTDTLGPLSWGKVPEEVASAQRTRFSEQAAAVAADQVALPERETAVADWARGGTQTLHFAPETAELPEVEAIPAESVSVAAETATAVSRAAEREAQAFGVEPLAFGLGSAALSAVNAAAEREAAVSANNEPTPSNQGAEQPMAESAAEAVWAVVEVVSASSPAALAEAEPEFVPAASDFVAVEQVPDLESGAAEMTAASSPRAIVVAVISAGSGDEPVPVLAVETSIELIPAETVGFVAFLPRPGEDVTAEAPPPAEPPETELAPAELADVPEPGPVTTPSEIAPAVGADVVAEPMPAFEVLTGEEPATYPEPAADGETRPARAELAPETEPAPAGPAKADGRLPWWPFGRKPKETEQPLAEKPTEPPERALATTPSAASSIEPMASAPKEQPTPAMAPAAAAPGESTAVTSPRPEEAVGLEVPCGAGAELRGSTVVEPADTRDVVPTAAPSPSATNELPAERDALAREAKGSATEAPEVDTTVASTGLASSTRSGAAEPEEPASFSEKEQTTPHSTATGDAMGPAAQLPATIPAEVAHELPEAVILPLAETAPEAESSPASVETGPTGSSLPQPAAPVARLEEQLPAGATRQPTEPKSPSSPLEPPSGGLPSPEESGAQGRRLTIPSGPAWLRDWHQAVSDIAAGRVASGLDRQATAVRELLDSPAVRSDGPAALSRLPGVDDYAAGEVLDLPNQRRTPLLLALARAEAFCDCNMPMSAMQELEVAIVAEPDFLPAQIALGHVYERTGHRKAANAKYAAVAAVCELRGLAELATELRHKAQAAA